VHFPVRQEWGNRREREKGDGARIEFSAIRAKQTFGLKPNYSWNVDVQGKGGNQSFEGAARLKGGKGETSKND